MYETNFMALLKFTNAIGTSPLQWISKIQGVKKVIFHYLLTEKVIFKCHIYLQFEFNLNHSVLRKCHIKSCLTFWKHKHKKFFQLCKIAKLITIGYRFSWPAKNLAHWVLNFFIKGFLIFIHQRFFEIFQKHFVSECVQIEKIKVHKCYLETASSHSVRPNQNFPRKSIGPKNNNLTTKLSFSLTFDMKNILHR